MQDPYLIEHKSYLNIVSKSVATDRLRPYRKNGNQASLVRLRAIAVVAMFMAIVAFQPWEM